MIASGNVFLFLGMLILAACHHDSGKSVLELPSKPMAKRRSQTDKVILVNENDDYTLRAEDFGIQPSLGNYLTSVVIDAFVAKGSMLRLGGKTVEEKQVIPLVHLPFLVFIPGENENGHKIARMDYRIMDASGVTGSQKQLSFSVRARGANGEVSIQENNRYTLTLQDLGFQSHGQEDKQSVIVHGFSNSDNKKGQWFFKAQLLDVYLPLTLKVEDLHQVVFIPEPGMSGMDYTRLLFSVDDRSVEARKTDEVERKMLTVNVQPTPHKPLAQDRTLVVDENQEYRFKPDDFTFSHIDSGNVLKSVLFKKITYAKPGREEDTHIIKPGQLFLGVDTVDLGKEVLADTLPLLRFVPDVNRNGKAYAAIDFSVMDDTGLVSDARTLSMDVRPVGVDGSVTLSGGHTITLSLDDFGFEIDDQDDYAITVTLQSLPRNSHIEIQLRTVPVLEGQVIMAKDIDAGFLKVVYKGIASNNMIDHYEDLEFVISDARIENAGHKAVAKTLTIHVVHHHKRHHHRHGEIRYENGLNRIIKTVNDPNDSHAVYGFSPEDFLFSDGNEDALKAVVITNIIFDPRVQQGDFFLGREKVTTDDLIGMQLLKDEISFLYFIPKPPFMYVDDPFVTLRFYSDGKADQTNIHENRLVFFFVPLP